MKKDRVLLGTGQVARLLNLSPMRIRQLDDDGHLPATFRTAKGWRLFTRDVVEAFRRARTRGTRHRSIVTGGTRG
jgi:DNA-binding transcriptional MerR regulator